MLTSFWIRFLLVVVAGAAVGVWEMTPGVATDVEEDEVFVVLSGSASIASPRTALPAWLRRAATRPFSACGVT